MNARPYRPLFALSAAFRPGRRIPFLMQKFALEHALAAALRDAADSHQLDVVRGRRIRIVIDDIGVDWCLTGTWRGMRLLRDPSGAEVTFRGNLREFVLLASRTVDPDTLFFQRRLHVTGNTELGLSCKNLLDAVEADLWPRPLQLVLRAAAGILAAQDAGRPDRG